MHRNLRHAKTTNNNQHGRLSTFEAIGSFLAQCDPHAVFLVLTEPPDKIQFTMRSPDYLCGLL